MGPNATAAHQQQLNEDNRQALVLFSIVIIFFVSNVPRILLNLHEVFTIGKYKEDVENGCKTLPFWVLLSGNISQLFMMANSSMNFFIYCIMSTIFREVLSENVLYYGRVCCLPFSRLLALLRALMKSPEDPEAVNEIPQTVATDAEVNDKKMREMPLIGREPTTLQCPRLSLTTNSTGATIRSNQPNFSPLTYESAAIV